MTTRLNTAATIARCWSTVLAVNPPREVGRVHHLEGEHGRHRLLAVDREGRPPPLPAQRRGAARHVCFGACGHILDRDQARFIRQVASVLRPRGRFVMVTSHMPPVRSRRYWLARAFNAVMRVRNLLVSPPFVMYYLTFLLPGVRRELERQGFRVALRPVADTGPLSHLRLISATLAPG